MTSLLKQHLLNLKWAFLSIRLENTLNMTSLRVLLAHSFDCFEYIVDNTGKSIVLLKIIQKLFQQHLYFPILHFP